MPVEASRVTRTIKIPVPGSDTLFWPVRVIDQISFLDKARGWQEHVYSYANNAAAARVTSVVNVGPEGSSIAVERIDALSMRDEREGWQEYIWEFAAPHVRTHDKVIQAVDADGNKNEDVTLTVRRIDAFSFLDKVEGWQETVFDLAWDDAGEYDYLDAPNAVSVGAPYRLDPYQMIVDIQSGFVPDWAVIIANQITFFEGAEEGIQAFFSAPPTTSMPPDSYGIGNFAESLPYEGNSSNDWWAIMAESGATPEPPRTRATILLDLNKIRSLGVEEIQAEIFAYWEFASSDGVNIRVLFFKDGTYVPEQSDRVGEYGYIIDYTETKFFTIWTGQIESANGSPDGEPETGSPRTRIGIVKISANSTTVTLQE